MKVTFPKKCELCGEEIAAKDERFRCDDAKYFRLEHNRLRGFCLQCSSNMGGGIYSATGVREELRAMKRRQK